MEETILIRSKNKATIGKLLKWGPVILFGIAALISIILSFEYEYEYYSGWRDQILTDTEIGWALAFMFPYGTALFVLFIIGCVSLLASIVLGIILLIVYLNSKCELVVTEQNVKGRTLLGKEVVLPLHMVSAYSTRKFLSTIVVVTSSGITRFGFIENYKEIGDVLEKKINEIQANTSNASTIASTTPKGDSLDDLKKLKELLDAGVITQEEFDAKKKQLLGL